MLKKRDKQGEMEIVILEQMIPENHLLRRIDRAVDFSFIHKLCEPLYCLDNGRPAVDPELLFRMIFIGPLRSDFGMPTGGRDQLQPGVQVVLRTWDHAQGAGCDDPEREPASEIPGQQHCGADF